MIKVICDWCETEYETHRAWYKRTKRHYCSRECALDQKSDERLCDPRLKEQMEIARASRPDSGKSYIKKDGKRLHRTIVEELIGRKLEDREVVHHKDRNHRNNDPSNLEIKNWGEHTRDHRIAYGIGRKIVNCEWCNEEFELSATQRSEFKYGRRTIFCCSVVCAQRYRWSKVG